MSKDQTIANYKAKMDTVPIDSPIRSYYNSIIQELEQKKVKLHVEQGPTCEGCQ